MYDFPLDFSHSFRITLTSKFESIWPFQSNAIYNCDSLSQHSLLLLLLLHAPWLLTATHVANEPKMQSQHCVCVWLSMCVCMVEYVCAVVCVYARHCGRATSAAISLDFLPTTRWPVRVGLLCNNKPEPLATCISSDCLPKSWIMMRPNSKLCNEINMHNASEAYRER